VPPLFRERLAALDVKRNPLLAGADVTFFVAESPSQDLSDDLVGTIAAWGDPAGKIAWFGALEAVNRPEVVAALLEAAETWAQEHLPAVRVLRGPACLDVRDPPGLLVDGFDRKSMAHLPYNSPYLPDLVEEAGFSQRPERWLTWELALSGIAAGHPAERPPGIIIRPANASDWPAEQERLAGVYDAAGAGVERTSAFPSGGSVRKDTSAWRIEPELVFFAEADAGIVGAIFALPDLSPALRLANGRWIPAGWLAARLGRRWLRRLQVFPPAVLPQRRSQGIEAEFCRAAASAGAYLGFRQAVYGPARATETEPLEALRVWGAQKAQAFGWYEKALGFDQW